MRVEPEGETAASLPVKSVEPEIMTSTPPTRLWIPWKRRGPDRSLNPNRDWKPKPISRRSPSRKSWEIGEVKINLNIHPDLIAKPDGTEEFRVKLAGVLAAQALKKYPELTASPAVDPVIFAASIRGHVLKKLDPPRRSPLRKGFSARPEIHGPKQSGS